MLRYTVRQRLDGSGSWQRCHCELDMSRYWVTYTVLHTEVQEIADWRRWGGAEMAARSSGAYELQGGFCLLSGATCTAIAQAAAYVRSLPPHT